MYPLTTAAKAEALGLSFAEMWRRLQLDPWLDHWYAWFEDGAEHLRTGLAELADDPAPIDRSVIEVVGDAAIVTAVREVIKIVPELVARRLAAIAVVRCGAGHVDAMPDNAAGTVREATGTEKLEVCLLTADRGVIAHEFGHVWHRDPSPFLAPARDAAHREQIRDGLLAYFVEKDGTDREIIEEAMVRERAADRLASAWLGVTFDTTSRHHGERRRRGLSREIALSVARVAERAALKMGPPAALACDHARSLSPASLEGGTILDDEKGGRP